MPPVIFDLTAAAFFDIYSSFDVLVSPDDDGGKEIV
jgi:hypothetical protein